MNFYKLVDLFIEGGNKNAKSFLFSTWYDII